MFAQQFRLMINKKSFQISFTVMMFISLVTPLYYAIYDVAHSADVSIAHNQLTAYIYNSLAFGTNIEFLLPLILPLIAAFPFSFSYAADRKLGCAPLFMLRGGIRRYYVSKALCCMIGSFAILFIPTLLNIAVNTIVFPTNNFSQSASVGYFRDIVFNMLGDGETNHILFEHLYLTNGVAYNIAFAFMISVASSVCGLVAFASSLVIRKNTVFAALPALVIFLVTSRLAEIGLYLPQGGSLALVHYLMTEDERAGTLAYPIIVFSILAAISFAVIIYRSGKDQL